VLATPFPMSHILYFCEMSGFKPRSLDSNPEGLVNEKIEIVLFELSLCMLLDQHVKELLEEKFGVQVMRTPGWKELILSDQGLLVEAFDSLAR
jgi:hypothetical protein